MTIIIENNIAGHTFILIPQEDGPNDIINFTFLLLAQEDGHNLWVLILKIIDDPVKK